MASYFTNYFQILCSCVLIALLSNLCVSEAQDYPPVAEGLSLTFYDTSCPDLEATVRKQLEEEFTQDIGQAAGLLRLHFHDCFVQVTNYILYRMRSDMQEQLGEDKLIK